MLMLEMWRPEEFCIPIFILLLTIKTRKMSLLIFLETFLTIGNLIQIFQISDIAEEKIALFAI